MYHRARAGRDGNSADMLEAHFRHIAAHCRNVLPGEPLSREHLNVCISFDDAYFDFHAVVLPLLAKSGLRALLAVSPDLLHERTDVPDAERLAVPAGTAFRHTQKGGFCTWPELRAMSDSGHVAVAAHGYTHVRVDLPQTDFDIEIHAPRTVLGARLGRPIDSFVFPHGKFSRLALGEAKRGYRHVFRIGGAMNPGWNGRILYRVRADAMKGPGALFSPARMAGYRARFVWNRIRGR